MRDSGSKSFPVRSAFRSCSITPNPNANANSTVLHCTIEKLLTQGDNLDSIPKSHCHASLAESGYRARSNHEEFVFGVFIHLIIVVRKQ